jgi:ABC-type nitrate/sulfonate/bicarbonate transport system substrate-binding protein
VSPRGSVRPELSRSFLFSIFSRPDITRIADLKGKLFGATRFGTLSDFASRFALEKNGLNPERDITGPLPALGTARP